MTGRRLIPAEDIAAAEHDIAWAVGAAVDDQRRSVKATMRSHGLVAAGKVPKASVWSQAAWVKAVHAHVAPVAATAVAALVSRARVSMPAAASWGAPSSDAAMSAHIVDVTLGAGERVGGALAAAAGASGDVMAGVDGVLDSAAGWVGDLAGRLAVGVGNWVTSDLAVHLGGQQPSSVTLTWNTVGDERVRDDHAEADGQTVAAGDPFDIGGEALMFPGDPSGSDANTANCRCFVTTDDGSTDTSNDPNADATPFGD